MGRLQYLGRVNVGLKGFSVDKPDLKITQLYHVTSRMHYNDTRLTEIVPLLGRIPNNALFCIYLEVVEWIVWTMQILKHMFIMPSLV